MKLPTGTVLPFLAWSAPKATIRGEGDITTTSAQAVIRAAGAEASCSWFKQPLDHENPKLGSWQQLYCVNPSNWAGPGSPVGILFYFFEKIFTRPHR